MTAQRLIAYNRDPSERYIHVKSGDNPGHYRIDTAGDISVFDDIADHYVTPNIPKGLERFIRARALHHGPLVR